MTRNQSTSSSVGFLFRSFLTSFLLKGYGRRDIGHSTNERDRHAYGLLKIHILDMVHQRRPMEVPREGIRCGYRKQEFLDTIFVHSRIEKSEKIEDND